MNEFLKCAINIWIIDFLEKNGPSTGHEIWKSLSTVMVTGMVTERLEKEGILIGKGSPHWLHRIYSINKSACLKQSEDEMVISDLLQSNGNEKFESDIAAKVLLLIKESKNVSS